MRRLLLSWTGWIAAAVVQAQPVGLSPEALAAALERQRLEAAERRTSPPPSLGVGQPDWALPVAGETPCRVVDALRVEGWQDASAGLRQVFKAFAGLCLGAGSLAALRKNFDLALTQEGYLTSRVVLPKQSLADGQLVVQVLVGRVASIDDEGTASGAHWRQVLDLQPGDVLNVRRLDAALDLLNRRVGVRTSFRLEPGIDDGSTRVVAVHEATGRLGLEGAATTLVDDDYGKVRMDASGVWDEPLGRADQWQWQLSSSAGRSLAFQRSASSSYALPWGQDLFLVHASLSWRRLPVQGTTVTFVTRGQESNLSLRWSRTLWRDASRKIGMSASVGERQASAALDDTELILQRRRRAQVEVGIDAWQRTDAALWSMSLKHGRSRRSGSRNAFLADDDARTRWVKGSVQVAAGFDDGPLRQWTASVDGQVLRHPASPSDLFIIGGNDTVRGFSARDALAGESGLVLRHELLGALFPWPATEVHTQPFAVLDLGTVRGASTMALPRRNLAGAGLGLRFTGRAAQGAVQAELLLSAPLPVLASGPERPARRWLPSARLSVAL